MRITQTLLFSIGLMATGAPLLAAEPAPASLEEVLQGFDGPATSNTATKPPPPADSELEGILGGFEDSTALQQAAAPATRQGPWDLSGAATLSSSYNISHDRPAAGATDYRGLSRLRGKLNLELKGNLGEVTGMAKGWRFKADGYSYYDLAYRINGRSDYPDTLLDVMEQETRLGEFYVQGSLNPSLDLKLGRQIVVWGKSDNLRVTDVINPLDLREPGLVDIEDLRLPLGMARLDYYLGDWSLSGLLIPEQRVDKTPPPGSEFYPFAGPMPPHQTPEQTLANSEAALALNGIFSGWDIAFYAARLNDNQPHAEISGGPVLRHSRLTMLGSAVNVASGNWLYMAEAAHLDGLEFTSQPGRTFRRSDLLLGVEYNGLTNASLSLELADRHLHDYQPSLKGDGYREDELQAALRYKGDFRHDRLHLTLLSTLYGLWGEDGGFNRASLAYDLEDALTLTGGLITYQEGWKLPFNRIADNDRVFVDLKYSF